MRINGRWLPDADGTMCPTVPVSVKAHDSSWRMVDFLVDTGADRTVFSADLVADLGLAASPAVQLRGVGGLAPSVWLQTSLRLERDDRGTVTFASHFVGFTALSALDMSLLGRDILNHFAVIVDHPGKIVCLLAPRHHYQVVFV
jgi:aspartyl protease